MQELMLTIGIRRIGNRDNRGNTPAASFRGGR